MNWELPDVQAGFRTNRGTRDQIANIHWITEQARELKKKSTSASLMMLKPLTVWIITNWKILKETRISNHLTCLLRNLFTGQEATVRTRHVIMDCFKIGKGVYQGSYCHPVYLTYTEYIMQKCRAEWRLPGEISITLHTQMIPF